MSDLWDMLDNEARKSFKIKTRGEKWAYQQGREDERKEHEETFEWCTDCKEYDQENHCCHRWSKLIAKDYDENLQHFAQWLWDNHYLVPEAFTIKLVEEYKNS